MSLGHPPAQSYIMSNNIQQVFERLKQGNPSLPWAEFRQKQGTCSKILITTHAKGTHIHHQYVMVMEVQLIIYARETKENSPQMLGHFGSSNKMKLKYFIQSTPMNGKFYQH